MPSLSLVNVPVASRGIHNHCIACQNWAQRSVHNVWWWGWGWCFPHSRTFRSQHWTQSLSPFTFPRDFLYSRWEPGGQPGAYGATVALPHVVSSRIVKQGPHYFYSLCRDFSTTSTGSTGPMYNTSATVVQYSNKDYFSRLGTIICYSPEQEPLRKQSLHSICLCCASLLVKPTQDSQGNSISRRIRSSWLSNKKRHFLVLCLKQTQHTSV